MTNFTFDWAGVLTGNPAHWLFTGLLMTILVTVASSLLATAGAVLVLGLRLAPGRFGRWSAGAFVEIFRNTPLLVQLLFWYFAAYTLLPEVVRQWITQEHPWFTLPGGVYLLTPEFLSATWGIGLFFAVFLTEELRSGLLAIPAGQRDAAESQGFGYWATLRYILLPQAFVNAWQPLIGQYLNLMKLTSLAAGIGLAELTYRVREIESYNGHALEAFAVGTAIYLIIGTVMGQLLMRFGPRRKDARSTITAVTRATGAAFGERHDA